MLEFASYTEGSSSRLFCLDILVPEHREPTSGLEPLSCSLRVCGQWLLGVAAACKSRIDKRFLVLTIARYCSALRPG
jgi:hypothetical protein